MTTTRTTTKKAYKGLPMEGPIATWYTKNVARDLSRFTKVAQAVANRVAPGSRVLEVAPGPGFLAIELAKTGRYRVTGLDISESFVRIAREKCSQGRRHSRLPSRQCVRDAVSRRSVRFCGLHGRVQELQRSARRAQRNPPCPGAGRRGVDLRPAEGRVAGRDRTGSTQHAAVADQRTPHTLDLSVWAVTECVQSRGPRAAGGPEPVRNRPARARWYRLRAPAQGLEQRHQRPLVLEQPAFAVQAAAEAGQLPPRPDHAVTGNDDRNWVFAVGGAHSAGGAGVAEPAGQLAIARGGAVGDGAEQIPHHTLERRAGRVERQIERRPGAGEVLLQLVPSPGEQRAGGAVAVVLPRRPPLHSVQRRKVAGRREVDAGERSVRGRQDELAEGAREAGEGGWHGSVDSRAEARVHALLEESPLHGVARHRERCAEVLARGLAPAAAQLQLTERRVVEWISGETITVGDRTDLLEPAPGALALGDGDGAVERDHGGRTNGHQRVVERNDLRPIRVCDAGRRRVNGRDRGLDVIRGQLGAGG